MPLVGRGIARTQPIWAEDAADCVLAALDDAAGAATPATSSPARRRSPSARSCGSCSPPPGRRRRALPLPLAGLRAALRAEETLAGPTALVTWDEAQLLAVEMLSAGGTAGAEALGVTPAPDGGRFWAVVRPRVRRLDLRRELQQQVLVERLADDLDAGRQPVGAEADRAPRSRAGR